MWSQQRARTLMFEKQSRILPLTEKSSASKAPPATKPALAEASVRTCDANCQRKKNSLPTAPAAGPTHHGTGTRGGG